MAYAYARRTVAAGLFLQGVFSREHYAQASKMFKVYQMNTGHSVEFQEEASRQAEELLSSYDPRLDKQAIVFITTIVERNQTPEKYDGIICKTYDFIMDMLQKSIKASNQDNEMNDLDKKFEKSVKQDAKRIAEIVNREIRSKSTAMRFVLEELDAARQGNEYAVSFVETCGIPQSEYVGAMEQTKWGDDKNPLEPIQQLVRSQILYLLADRGVGLDREIMSMVTIAVLDEIMKTWKLGKYAS
jgi:hypothetical protein